MENNVLVVLSCNLHWAPYYYRYEKALGTLGIKYDLILWNREGLTEEVSSNVNLIEFKLSDKTNDGSVHKISKFIKFALFVKQIIKRNRYSKIVFLGTYAFMPALLSAYLEKNYKGKYWIDLRDLTYENNPLYYSLEKKAIMNAYHVVISSKGYLDSLPQCDYGYIHNIDPSMDDIYKNFHKTQSSKIRISYIGNIGYWNSVKAVIDTFANDDRFLLTFAGTNTEKVKEYCNEMGIENVETFGKFKQSDTVLFYNNTDIVYNVYGNDTVNVKTACSNKLYYAMKFHMPLLVSPDTYMEKICKKYGIGFVFEANTDYPDKLYQMYCDSLKTEHFFEDAFNSVLKEDKECSNDFIKFIG